MSQMTEIEETTLTHPGTTHREVSLHLTRRLQLTGRGWWGGHRLHQVIRIPLGMVMRHVISQARLRLVANPTNCVSRQITDHPVCNALFLRKSTIIQENLQQLKNYLSLKHSEWTISRSALQQNESVLLKQQQESIGQN